MNLSHTTRRAVPHKPGIVPQGSNVHSVPASGHSIKAPAATHGSIYTTGLQQQPYNRFNRKQTYKQHNVSTDDLAGQYKGRPVVPTAGDYYYSEISDTAYSATGLAGSMFQRQLPPIKPQPNAEAQYYSEIEEAAYYKKLLPPPLPDKHPKDHTYHRPTHVSPTIGQPNMDNETEYTGEKEHSKKKKDKKQKKNIKHWSHKAGRAGRKK